MAMMASKELDEAAPAAGTEVRSVVDEARRSVAEGPPLEVDWICEAEKRLRASSEGLPRRVCTGGAPLRGKGELPRARTRLDDNVGLADAALGEFGPGALDERLDDGRVPARVDDGDAQARAVVVLGRRALERHGGRGWTGVCLHKGGEGSARAMGQTGDTVVDCLGCLAEAEGRDD